jgi:hypothetical protein
VHVVYARHACANHRRPHLPHLPYPGPPRGAGPSAPYPSRAVAEPNLDPPERPARALTAHSAQGARRGCSLRSLNRLRTRCAHLSGPLASESMMSHCPQSSGIACHTSPWVPRGLMYDRSQACSRSRLAQACTPSCLAMLHCPMCTGLAPPHISPRCNPRPSPVNPRQNPANYRAETGTNLLQRRKPAGSPAGSPVGHARPPCNPRPVPPPP